MRLRVLHKYRPSFIQRVKFLVMRVLFGPTALDAGRAAFYRPEMFTRPYYRLQQEVLRGPSKWDVGERELFAAFTAVKLRCEFCTVAHTAFASAARSPAWVESALERRQSGGENSQLSAMLAFLEKLTEQPWNVTHLDIQRLREAGLGERAIEEAVMVCVVFNIGSRISDVLNFEVPSPAAIRRATPFILRLGYHMYR